MTRDDMTKLAHRVYEAANARDVAAVDDIFAPDFYSHPMRTTGTDAVKQAWTTAMAKYPDLRVEPDEILVDGDRVATRCTVHGIRNTADGAPAYLTEFIRMADGRIAELWGVTNVALR
jgi:predicted SnoaL-like aldol condensation-catalyzing enzyme